jgi:putative ABC transport system permease protein
MVQAALCAPKRKSRSMSSEDAPYPLRSRAESGFTAAAQRARMTLLIAWRNLVHDRIRFAITLVGIAFSTILMGIQLGMLLNFVHTISTIVDHAGADLWITAEGVPSVDLATPQQERRRYQAMAADGVASAESYMLHFGFLKRPDGVRQIVVVIGVDPDAEMGLPFDLVDGVDARQALAEPDGAIIDRLYQEKLGVRGLGETLEINGRRIRIVGFTNGIRTFTQSPYVFMSLAKARTLFIPPDNDISYVLVRVAPGHRPEEVAATLSARMSEVEVLTAAEIAARSQYHWLVTTGAGVTLVSSTLLAIFVGVVIVAQTLYASTMDRLPEYAVIRAMGGPRSYLYKIIIQQAVLGGLFGAAVGLVVIALVVAGTRQLSAAPEVPPWLALGIVVATMLMCVAASVGSIGKVMRIDPVKVFR